MWSGSLQASFRYKLIDNDAYMAQALKRPLMPYEQVHHINGQRDDNRLENLQLRSGPHGKGSVVRCADCGSRNVIFEKIVSLD